METEATLKLYDKDQVLRYRTKIAKAHFLDGVLARVLWREFSSDRGHQKSTCLLLSTDIQSVKVGMGFKKGMAANTKNLASLSSLNHGGLRFNPFAELHRK